MITMVNDADCSIHLTTPRRAMQLDLTGTTPQQHEPNSLKRNREYYEHVGVALSLARARALEPQLPHTSLSPSRDRPTCASLAVPQEETTAHADDAHEASDQEDRTSRPPRRIQRPGVPAAIRLEAWPRDSPPIRPDDKDGHYVFVLGENLGTRCGWGGPCMGMCMGITHGRLGVWKWGALQRDRENLASDLG